MENLRLRPCREADLPRLRQLSLQTFSEAFKADNDPEDFQAYLEKAFDPRQLRAEWSDPDTRFFFLLFKDEVVGYCKLNSGAAQTEMREASGMEIERFYVLGAWQGRGFGQWMLERIRERARAEGKSYLWLGVWEHNSDAIRFYKRFGFVIFDKHPYYIGSDRQMDWMMRLPLPPGEPSPEP